MAGDKRLLVTKHSMKTKITLPTVQKVSLANKLRLEARATTIVYTQALLMEAAQSLERLSTCADALVMVEQEMGSRISPAAFQEFSETCKNKIKSSLANLPVV